MREKEFDMTEYVVVEQLPKIKETFEAISREIDIEIAYARDLEFTEENKVEIKATRARIRKIKGALEERRRAVKEQIMRPYEVFEEQYNTLLKDKLNNVDDELKVQIDRIEENQKQDMTMKLYNFATEYLEISGLKGIVSAKSVMPAIRLSTSEKAYKEKIKAEIERIADEVQTIKLGDNVEETLVEYLKDYNLSLAQRTVLERHKQMDELKEHPTNDWQDNMVEATPTEEEVSVPIEIPSEDLIECTFTVRATREQLLKIKSLLTEMGVEYE